MDKIVIGIDLGTTNSCVGIWRNERLEIITDECGNRTIPSVVSFNRGIKYVGIDAKNQLDINSENTFYDVKRLIGQSFDEDVVQHDKQYLSYAIEKNDNVLPAGIFIKDKMGKTYCPEEICALVLIKLKNMANKYLGNGDNLVNNVVITVPAYFNDSQRHATRDAAKIAGLNCIRMLNEPTAAALAYGLYNRNGNILVYDLGGGTLDVSLINIEDGVFQVIAVSGNTHIGGEDFDNRLVTYCISEFKKKNKLGYLKEMTFDNIQKVKKACELCKRTLTNTTMANVHVGNFYCGIDMYVQITREKFEQLCNDFFIMCMKPVDDVLNDSQMDKKDIDDIVLVGGSTRIPKIQTMLESMFMGKKLNKGMNPDEVVAAGAAIQGYILSHTDDPFSERMVLLDVTPLTFGIETLGKIMTPIIKRNSAVPVRKVRKFTTDSDDASSVNIRVFEGERKMTKDNYLVGEFVLNGIEPAPRGIAQIQITYKIDVNNMMSIVARELKSGSESTIQINSNKGRLSEEEIEELILEAQNCELKDKLIQEKMELQYEIEDLCSNMKHNLKTNELQMKDDDIIKINEEIEEIMISNINMDKDELEKTRDRLMKKYGPLILKIDNKNNNEVKEQNIGEGTNVYGDSEIEIDLNLENENEINLENKNDELKNCKKVLEELCISLLTIIKNNNLKISDEDKNELNDYLDKIMLLIYIKDEMDIDDYKKTIDDVNSFSNDIFVKYNEDIFEKPKEKTKIEELEELCYSIKFGIMSNHFSLSKHKLNILENEIDGIIKNIYAKEKDINFDATLEFDRLNELCNNTYNNNLDLDFEIIDNNNINDDVMSTPIKNNNVINERIADLLLEVDRQFL
jgi:molecular chaperone DnaK (HSP70)